MAFMDYVKLYRVKSQEAWTKLNSRQKWIFGGIGAAIFLGFMLLVASFGSGKGGEVALALPVSDPDKAVTTLARYSIKSRFDEKKKNVVVDREHEEKAALILAANRLLPNAAKYYGFLYETDLTRTDAQTQETIRIGLQQRLADTIQAMDFISDASVDISPAARPFHFPAPAQNLSAKASVTIGLRGQDMLNDEQVASIAQLVSGTYPSLQPDAVSIVDKSGRLYRFNKDWMAIVDMWRSKARYEEDAARKVSDLLTGYNPRVAATIPIRTRTEEIDSVKYDGDGKPVYAEGRDHSATGVKRAGPSGATGEIGRDAAVAPGVSRFETEERTAETLEKMVYDTTNSHTKDGNYFKPEYENATIAVTLDEQHKEKLTPDIDKITDVVARSTSIPKANISILFVPGFGIDGEGGGGGALTGIAATLLKPENLVKIVLLVLAIGAFIALMLMLRKSAPKPLTLLDDEQVEEEPEAMPEIPTLPPVSQLEGNVVREKVVQLVKKNPKAAANLIKRWMILGK